MSAGGLQHRHRSPFYDHNNMHRDPILDLGLQLREMGNMLMVVQAAQTPLPAPLTAPATVHPALAHPDHTHHRKITNGEGQPSAQNRAEDTQRGKRQRGDPFVLDGLIPTNSSMCG